MPTPPTDQDFKRHREQLQARMAEAHAKAVAAFRFERVEVPGDTALAKWEELKSAGRGLPVVLGGDDAIARLGEALSDNWYDKRTAAEIIAAADRLKHPTDLYALRVQEKARAAEFLKKHMGSIRYALFQLFALGPRTGWWPSQVEPAPGLTVAIGRPPLEKVHIALIPTDDWTTIPAHLRWGGWNDCPAPEYHVAALRSWRDRFGAELVGLNSDTMNLTVKRKPVTRADAMELAREHYAYCNDIVDQGVGTLRTLAASLMISSWWFFWWD